MLWDYPPKTVMMTIGQDPEHGGEDVKTKTMEKATVVGNHQVKAEQKEANRVKMVNNSKRYCNKRTPLYF